MSHQEFKEAYSFGSTVASSQEFEVFGKIVCSDSESEHVEGKSVDLG